MCPFIVQISRPQETVKQYRELGQNIQVHHNTVKEYLAKMTVHRKAKKFAPQQFLIKARFHYFIVKSIYKCVMDDEFYFIVEGNEWQQKSYYDSENHPAIENVKFIRKTKFSATFLLWLTVSEYGVSKSLVVSH
jgi:hypothetical protein